MTETKTSNMTENKSTEASHILYIEGEAFLVYHLNRRLYKFLDWKDSRDKLIKIIIGKLREKLGIDTAYIEFKMANPMRKSRLGNFYIDIQADILSGGKSLGTVEELGVKQIYSDTFDTLDKEESELRSTVEEKHSSEQYATELKMRVDSLKNLVNNGVSNITNFTMNGIKSLAEIAEDLMLKEGWSKTQDNRIHARRRRVSQFN